MDDASLPCWRCGARGSCDHREVDPPPQPAARPAADPYKPRYGANNGHNFGTRKFHLPK